MPEPTTPPRVVPPTNTAGGIPPIRTSYELIGNIPDYSKLRTLMRSRKFWTTVIASSITVYLYANGNITAETLADSAALIAGIYVGSVALEDGLSGLANIWTRT